MRREPVVERLENMTTEALDRVTGQVGNGVPFSVIAKVLRPASAWPMFHTIPEEHHAAVLATLDWHDEPKAYRCGVGEQLPSGIRMPRLYSIDEDPDAERVTLWLEDVADTTSWSLARYRRTARALGEMGGQWRDRSASERFGICDRDISTMFYGRILNHDLPLQASDEFWGDPLVANLVDEHHRQDLGRLAALMPSLLDRLRQLPHGLAHGDASPNNFLEPGDGVIVAIDWSYASVSQLGSDLAQLLAGRFECGDAEAESVELIASAIFDAYCEGVDAAGATIDGPAIEQAWATHLAVRSVFPALLIDASEARPDRRASLLHGRAALARFGLDLALRYATATRLR